MKFIKSSFHKPPKRFDVVDMIFFTNKLIYTMFYPVMILVIHIIQALIFSPVIRMNDTIRAHFTLYNALKCLFCAIRDNFRVCFTSVLPTNGHLSSGTTAYFPFYTSGTKIRFINFHFFRKWRRFITKPNDAISNKLEVSVNCISIHPIYLCVA